MVTLKHAGFVNLSTCKCRWYCWRFTSNALAKLNICLKSEPTDGGSSCSKSRYLVYKACLTIRSQINHMLCKIMFNRDKNIYKNGNIKIEKVKVSNDREMVQSERNSLSKSRGENQSGIYK